MTKALSIVMPVYNEAQGLEAAVDEVHAVLRARGYDPEIIIVDDASTDGTYALACSIAARLPSVRAERHPRNLGPCSGLATGARLAKHAWVLLLPADIAIPLEDVDVLWEAREQADIVVGYVAADAGLREPLRHLQSRLYAGLVNALFGLGVRQVNYVTLYPSRLFHAIELTTEGVARHAEILARGRRAGLSLTEVPLGYRRRQHGSATGNRPSVIAKTLWEILRLRVQLELSQRHKA